MFQPLPIPGLMLVRPQLLRDERGFLSEVWSRGAFAEAGLDFDWHQENHSLSRDAGTLRGLHFQAPPAAQAKLVRCVRGRIWDVAVDVRRGSPTEGRWHGVELSPENWSQLLIPRGCLHGFVTLERETEVIYKVDHPYDRDSDGAVAWDDPDLAIEWPLAGRPRLSPKDEAAPRLTEWSSPFVWEA